MRSGKQRAEEFDGLVKEELCRVLRRRGDMLPRLLGHHYHEISDPAWFGLWDFKVLLLEKPATAPPPKPQIKDVKGFRWGGMR